MKKLIAATGLLALIAASALGATAANAEEPPPEAPPVEAPIEEIPPVEIPEETVEEEAPVAALTVVDVDYVTVAWYATEGDIWNPPQTVAYTESTDEPNLDALDDELAAHSVACGTSAYFQIDVYVDDATTTALLAGGILYGPNDPPESLIPGGSGTAWKFVKLTGDDCPPPPTMQECTTYSTVHHTNEADVNTSESSIDGSSTTTWTADGIQIETADAGHRKAAGYIAVNFPLSDLGEFVLTSTGSGVAPGGQIRIDRTGDGVWDFTLVVEPIYGGIQWASIPGGGTWVSQSWAPHAAGGGGYPNQGTFDEWLALNPTATVTQIGYSLGSGVTGDALITSIKAGCVEHTFGLPVPEIPPTELPETPALAVTGLDEGQAAGALALALLLLVGGALAVLRSRQTSAIAE